MCEVGLTFLFRDADSFAELVGVIAIYAELGEIGHHVRVDGEIWIEHFGL